MKSTVTRALKSLVGINSPRSSVFQTGAFHFLKNPATGTKTITPNSSLAIPAFYNAVDQVTNDIAKLPKSVYIKTEKGRQKDASHPVTTLINSEPSELLTAFMFWKMMTQSAILRGNGIALIHRNSVTAEISSLEFVHPDDLHNIKKHQGKLFYFIKGFSEPFTQEDILHIPGFSFNGVTGISVIAFAAQTLGIGANIQDFTYENFDKKGIGVGAIETEKSVTWENKKLIEDKIESKLSGHGRVKTLLLDEGMTYKSILMTPEDAKIIDSGKVNVIDICRYLNINPHKIKMLDGANYNVLELLSIEHASDSILPWSIKIIQECNRKFFSKNEKAKGYYVWFNDNILLRADLQTKGEYYSKMATVGALTRNEIRAFEELNHIDGLDEPLTPANTQTMSQINQKMKENE